MIWGQGGGEMGWHGWGVCGWRGISSRQQTCICTLCPLGALKKVIWLNLDVAIFKLTDLEVNHLIYSSTQGQKLNP